MDIISKISEAIWELEAMNCRRDDMIIAYSPLVERFLIDEIHERKLFLVNINSLEKLEGIKTYNLHPYNEILIYDSKYVSYHPQLLKKIELSMVNKSQDNIKNTHNPA